MSLSFLFFFFNDPATTEIYTLSLHDALPICKRSRSGDCSESVHIGCFESVLAQCRRYLWKDRKSTRLNSSHEWISYAVFCLKKKKKENLHLELEIAHNAVLYLDCDHCTASNT